MGSRGLLCGRGASPLPLRGAKGGPAPFFVFETCHIYHHRIFYGKYFIYLSVDKNILKII